MREAACVPFECSVVHIRAAVDDGVVGMALREVIGSWFNVVLFFGSVDHSGECTMRNVTHDLSTGVTCVCVGGDDGTPCVIVDVMAVVTHCTNVSESGAFHWLPFYSIPPMPMQQTHAYVYTCVHTFVTHVHTHTHARTHTHTHTHIPTACPE